MRCASSVQTSGIEIGSDSGSCDDVSGEGSASENDCSASCRNDREIGISIGNDSETENRIGNERPIVRRDETQNEPEGSLPRLHDCSVHLHCRFVRSFSPE